MYTHKIKVMPNLRGSAQIAYIHGRYRYSIILEKIEIKCEMAKILKTYTPTWASMLKDSWALAHHSVSGYFFLSPLHHYFSRSPLSHQNPRTHEPIYKQTKIHITSESLFCIGTQNRFPPW